MPFVVVDGVRLYYESSGPEGAPTILQFGGSLFGRQNFHKVNDAFREKFQILEFDMSGYGRSDQPLTDYSVTGWADEGAGLLDALGVDRVLVHGTSMGGMIAIAFAALHRDRTIAACADCAIVRPDAARRLMMAHWRKAAECMTLDDLAALLAMQSVSSDYIDAHPEAVADTQALIRRNSPYTITQACVAMETLDLEPLIDRIDVPMLFTHGTSDIQTPADLAASGYGTRQLANVLPNARMHEFADVGHADLLERPDEAVAVVSTFFEDVLRVASREPAEVAS
jgi:pimeloyl-ACP methyl ester carboxylesterase